MNKIIKKFKTIGAPNKWKAILEDNTVIIITYKHHGLIIKSAIEVIHSEYIGLPFLDHSYIKQKLKFNGFTFQTEKTYDVDYENFKDNNTAEAFQHWWNEEGSSFTTEENEDPEEFMKRICGIAWNNGAYIQNK